MRNILKFCHIFSKNTHDSLSPPSATSLSCSQKANAVVMSLLAARWFVCWLCSRMTPLKDSHLLSQSEKGNLYCTNTSLCCRHWLVQTGADSPEDVIKDEISPYWVVKVMLPLLPQLAPVQFEHTYCSLEDDKVCSMWYGRPVQLYKIAMLKHCHYKKIQNLGQG